MSDATMAGPIPPAPARLDTARFGMWVFIASEVLFFGALLVAYGAARLHAPAGFAAASRQTDLGLGTLNTALLLSSSCAIAIAAEAAGGARWPTVRRGLWIAAALGAGFLAVKGVEYRNEWREGLFPGPGFRVGGRAVAGAELFFAWYFVATALHALHLLIGIVGCAVLALRADSRDVAVQVPVLALYWHFVDVVWILLYPLIYLVVPRT
ncbi:MAG TPA: cytochrome c oxidase subunit 3 [Burkholderiaceae bacterium]|jgi:cytochrome c oxidase subunit 3